MRHVPVAAFKDRASEYIAAAESGEDITITRHGREVARLTGIEQDRMARQRKAIENMLSLREELRAKGVSVSQEDWVAWKNEDRR